MGVEGTRFAATIVRLGNSNPMQFTVVAVDSNGCEASLEIVAENEDAAVEEAHKRGFFPTCVTPVPDPDRRHPSAATLPESFRRVHQHVNS